MKPFVQQFSSFTVFIFIEFISFVTSFPSGEVVTNDRQKESSDCQTNCTQNLADPFPCPTSNCPPLIQPTLNRLCSAPNCSNTDNRPFIFPHKDPNKFYQCRPINTFNAWEAIERHCGCETYFNYQEQRCVHPYEWVNLCSGTPINPPSPVPCMREYPLSGAKINKISSSSNLVTTTTLPITTIIDFASTKMEETITMTIEPTSTLSSTSMQKTTTTTFVTPPTSSFSLPSQPTIYYSTAQTSATDQSCYCNCWCPCSYSYQCWFPCACSIYNCSCPTLY